MTDTDEVRLKLVHARVRVTSGEPRLLALIERLWEPFISDEEGEPDATFEAAGNDGNGWTLHGPGLSDYKHPDVWGLVDVLRFEMLELVENQARGVVTFHAAAVARWDSLVVMAGRSGAGKTTLTRAFLEEGWTYWSDDLVPIDVRTGRVHPFPKPLGVKEPVWWDEKAAGLGDLELPRPLGSFLVPVAGGSAALEPALPTHLLFPEYRAGEALTVEELSPAKATAVATSFVRRLEPNTVEVLGKLASGCTCLSITYGRSRDVIRLTDSPLWAGTRSRPGAD